MVHDLVVRRGRTLYTLTLANAQDLLNVVTIFTLQVQILILFLLESILKKGLFLREKNWCRRTNAFLLQDIILCADVLHDRVNLIKLFLLASRLRFCDSGLIALGTFQCIDYGAFAGFFDAEEPAEIVAVTCELPKLFAPLFVDAIGFELTIVFVLSNLDDAIKITRSFCLEIQTGRKVGCLLFICHINLTVGQTLDRRHFELLRHNQLLHQKVAQDA